MSLEILFLGTGTSAGVPMIGCHCEVCSSSDLRDTRSRPSVLIRYGNGNHRPDRPDELDGDNPAMRAILIDTAPELRQQATQHSIDRLDAVMLTHAHADHLFGLDDLRRYNAVMQRPLEVRAEVSVIKQLHSVFRYIFEPHTNINSTFVANLIACPVEPGAAFELHGATWTPLRLLHGRLPILGFRIDFEGHAIAYCTDVSSIPPETYPLLQDLDVLVIDALRYRHHPTHMTVDRALQEVEQIQPKQAYFTHIAHDILHADLADRLPDGAQLAYDGLLVRAAEPAVAAQARPTSDMAAGATAGVDEDRERRDAAR